MELVTLSRKPYLAKTNVYLVGFWDWCILVLVQIYYTFLKSNSVHPFQRKAPVQANPKANVEFSYHGDHPSSCGGVHDRHCGCRCGFAVCGDSGNCMHNLIVNMLAKVKKEKKSIPGLATHLCLEPKFLSSPAFAPAPALALHAGAGIVVR